MRLIRIAAVMYRDISAGVIASASALLSKPNPARSLGRSASPSISSASRSWTALTYSVRFRRREATQPALAAPDAADASSEVSSRVTKSSTSAASGLGLPSGGISPSRSFRITFSSTSALAPTSPTSICSRVSPPVMRRSLWQLTQYWPNSGCVDGVP